MILLHFCKLLSCFHLFDLFDHFVNFFGLVVPTHLHPMSCEFFSTTIHLQPLFAEIFSTTVLCAKHTLQNLAQRQICTAHVHESVYFFQSGLNLIPGHRLTMGQDEGEVRKGHEWCRNQIVFFRWVTHHSLSLLHARLKKLKLFCDPTMCNDYRAFW